MLHMFKRDKVILDVDPVNHVGLHVYKDGLQPLSLEKLLQFSISDPPSNPAIQLLLEQSTDSCSEHSPQTALLLYLELFDITFYCIGSVIFIYWITCSASLSITPGTSLWMCGS
jgi:hypothetical protein